MIKDNGFSHPYDYSKEGFSSSVRGNVLHEFEPRGNKMVLDRTTGLLWFREAIDLHDVDDLRSAWLKVQELNKVMIGGYDGWRVPTFEELASLVEPIGFKGGALQHMFINEVFLTNSGYSHACLSADTVLYRKEGITTRGLSEVVVDFEKGSVGPIERVKPDCVRPVRTMSSGELKRRPLDQ